MKNQLSYQTTEYDCGPTTLTNAIRYLFEREEIMPELIKTISLYTLDTYDKNGEYGKSGTSCMAMMFLSNWFNHFGKIKNFPLYTEIILNDNVGIRQNNKLVECLQQGGTVILCVWLGDVKHYVLLTDIEDEYICLFDPYDWDVPVDGTKIKKAEDQPKKMNRKVRIDVINEESNDFYALGTKEGREAMLLYNVNSRITPEKSIEFFI
ncbi:MAG: hypothetical protein K0S76_1547 [Herbinix sp.]|jgi:hypothetical protein|nr:hypothetical protein [Herbinix sp.]